MPQTTNPNHGGSAMLTPAIVAHLTAIAGPDFTYPGVKGSGRPSAKDPRGGSPRRGLRAWLFVAQGGICPECGNALDLETAETAHVVSRGDKLLGFLPGNLMATHAWCNTAQKSRGPIVDPATLARPDVVALDWPVDKVAGFYAFDPLR